MLGYATYANASSFGAGDMAWSSLVPGYAYINVSADTHLYQFPASSITQLIWALSPDQGGSGGVDPDCTMTLEPVAGGAQLFDLYSGFQIQQGNSLQSYGTGLLGSLLVDSDNLPAALPWKWVVLNLNYSATASLICMSWAK